MMHMKAGIDSEKLSNLIFVTGADCVTQACRDGVDDGLAYVGDRQDDEYQTFDKHCSQCKLPWVSHSKAYAVHEESVEAHARSESERQFSDESHCETADYGGESC